MISIHTSGYERSIRDEGEQQVGDCVMSKQPIVTRRDTRIAVLLDTDIGSNVDDAIALSYLLRQPRCELLGISTVSGEPHRRAAIAQAVCAQNAREDVPIHVGAEAPLYGDQRQPNCEHFSKIEQLATRTFSLENTSVSFLIDTIRKRPDEVVLLTIGPLTNVANVFRTDPEIPGLLKEVVCMAGTYFDPSLTDKPEWNIWCDPEAADTVFQSSVSTSLIGLDVTRKCLLPKDDCLSRFAQVGTSMDLVTEMAKVWFAGRESIAFNAPLAAATIFEPGLCNMQPIGARVSLAQDSFRGDVDVTREDESPRKAAIDVDVQAFFNHYFEIVH